MRHLLFICALSLLSFSAPVQAEVRHCHAIEDLLEEVDANTLVLFDIDNTLIEMAQTLGSDQWFNQQLQNRLKAGAALDEALDELLPIWWRIVTVSDVVPVEDCTVDVFKKVQEQALAVVGLTSRGRELTECTRKQLESVEIDFQTHCVGTGHGRIVRYSSNDYEHGVIFCEGANKGFVSREFLDRYCAEEEIKKLVVVDDTMRHLQRVEEHLEDRQLEVLCFRYGVADDKVENFDATLANIQLRAFQFMMSDEMAKDLLEGRYEEAFQVFVEQVHHQMEAL